MMLCLKTTRIDDYLHLFYPNELEVKDTIDTQTSVSYLDLHIAIESRRQLKTQLYDNSQLPFHQ